MFTEQRRSMSPMGERCAKPAVQEKQLTATSLADFRDQVVAKPGNWTIHAEPVVECFSGQLQQKGRSQESDMRFLRHWDSFSDALRRSATSQNSNLQRESQGPDSFTQRWSTVYTARTEGKTIRWQETYGAKAELTRTDQDIVQENKGGRMQSQVTVTAIDRLGWLGTQVRAEMRVCFGGQLVGIDDARCTDLWARASKEPSLSAFPRVS